VLELRLETRIDSSNDERVIVSSPVGSVLHDPNLFHRNVDTDAKLNRKISLVLSVILRSSDV